MADFNNAVFLGFFRDGSNSSTPFESLKSTLQAFSDRHKHTEYY